MASSSKKGIFSQQDWLTDKADGFAARLQDADDGEVDGRDGLDKVASD